MTLPQDGIDSGGTTRYSLAIGLISFEPLAKVKAVPRDRMQVTDSCWTNPLLGGEPQRQASPRA